MIGGGMMDESSMINLQDMISNMMPKRNKKKSNNWWSKKILLESEMSKLIDMDEVKDEGIQRAENTGIIFIDEIDKICGGSKKRRRTRC